MAPFSALLRASTSALALLLLAGCTSAPASTAERVATTGAAADLRGERAVVDRVVDGDTVDVRKEGEIVRVRLLNIDTPETKDPDELVECLGPEATELLEELLPEGTEVGLEYDWERTDSYGRTLAGVFTGDGTLVNAEIARHGLGTPVYIAPNDRFLPPVEEAFAEAKQQSAGLLDPAHGCTIPARVQGATDALAGASPEELADPASGAAEAVALVAALEAVDRDTHPHLRHLLSTPPVRGLVSTLQTEISDLQGRAEELRRQAQAEAEQRRQAEAEAEQRRQAEAEQRRLTEAEAARRAAVPAAPAPAPVHRAPAPAPAPAPVYQPAAPAPAPAYQPPAPVPRPAPAPAPAPRGNIVNQAPPGYYADIPGYTGPRCYAPGGKFFKPC